MRVPKVFLPKVVEKFDVSAARYKPAYDFSVAAQYGMLTEILTKDDDVNFLSSHIPKIREALADYQADDFFIAVGDPSLIAVCAGIILRKHPSMKMLKWDRKMHVYFIVEIKP